MKHRTREKRYRCIQTRRQESVSSSKRDYEQTKSTNEQYDHEASKQFRYYQK
jgi:hypothetical protein